MGQDLLGIYIVVPDACSSILEILGKEKSLVVTFIIYVNYGDEVITKDLGFESLHLPISYWVWIVLYIYFSLRCLIVVFFSSDIQKEFYKHFETSWVPPSTLKN